jgi:peptide/nickel transport system permease protein
MNTRQKHGNVKRFANHLSPGAIIGMIILLTVIIGAVFAEQIAPQDPMKNRLIQKLRPPLGDKALEGYYLGTDELGRDIFSRLLIGAQPSIYIPLFAMLISMFLGVTIGIISGLGRGWLDDTLMRINDIQLSIPTILIIIALIAALGRINILTLILVLGATGWVSYARLIRGEVLSLREREFILAAKSQGSSLIRVMVRHILPNIAPLVIVIATFQLAQLVLIEAALSYIGLGIPVGTPSWGGMLSDGRNHFFTSWWYATFPGIAITMFVLGINLVGDWLRDVLDPHLQTAL